MKSDSPLHDTFLARCDFDLIFRAHMVVEDGCEVWNNRTLVTIFSAPNHCGEFGASLRSSSLLPSVDAKPPC